MNNGRYSGLHTARYPKTSEPSSGRGEGDREPQRSAGGQGIPERPQSGVLRARGPGRHKHLPMRARGHRHIDSRRAPHRHKCNDTPTSTRDERGAPEMRIDSLEARADDLQGSGRFAEIEPDVRALLDAREREQLRDARRHGHSHVLASGSARTAEGKRVGHVLR